MAAGMEKLLDSSLNLLAWLCISAAETLSHQTAGETFDVDETRWDRLCYRVLLRSNCTHPCSWEYSEQVQTPML